MATSGVVAIDEPTSGATDKKIDNNTVSRGGNTVLRQVVNIGDPETVEGCAKVGGGVEADALRVTIASDSTGLVTVDSPSVAAEGAALGEGVLIQGDDGTDRKNVLVDTDGHVQVDVLSGGGSGTQYTEDEVTANPIVGSAILVERDDALTTVTPAEADWIGLRGTAEGALWVQDFNSDAKAADLASIKTAVELIDNAISGSQMQVDVVAALPAGSNIIGVVDLGATDNAVLDAIAAASATVAAAVSTEMQVDIVGALPAGTAAIGKLAPNSGVDIGDVDVTSVPRSISGPAEPGTAVDSYATVAINLTTAANQVLVSSAPSKQIWVYGYAFTCGTADGQTVSLQDEDDAALTGIMAFAKYGGISVPPSGNFSMPIFKLGTDKDLEIDITGGDVDGWIAYAILSV